MGDTGRLGDSSKGSNIEATIRDGETPICPYIFHLYHLHELLLLAEKKEYRIKETS